jgi:flagellar basal body rod protein FlgG
LINLLINIDTIIYKRKREDFSSLSSHQHTSPTTEK